MERIIIVMCVLHLLIFPEVVSFFLSQYKFTQTGKNNYKAFGRHISEPYRIRNNEFISYAQYSKRLSVFISTRGELDNSSERIERKVRAEGFLKEKDGVKHSKVSDIIEVPKLTKSDVVKLSRGERVQKQSRDGRAGTGLVVLDIRAPPDEVFEVLSQIRYYNEMIPTVRSASIYSDTTASSEASDLDRTIAAEFLLSRFFLKLNVIHKILNKKRVIKFRLDSNRPNFVMRKADGYWYVEEIQDNYGRSYSRVYLSASIVVSRLVPAFVVDYAAARALPRATKWLQEYKERSQSVKALQKCIEFYDHQN